MAKRDSTEISSSRYGATASKKGKPAGGPLGKPWPLLAQGSGGFRWNGNTCLSSCGVRVITETAEQLPEIVRSALQSRCPGFLECHSRERKEHLPLWRSLEDWVAAHCFAKAKAEGWFDALMYYAYKDLRTEQAWTSWERTKADWRHTPPPRWPTSKEWTAEVLATRSLAHPGTEKARAVEALGRVEAGRLRNAVYADLIESPELSPLGWTAFRSQGNP